MKKIILLATCSVLVGGFATTSIAGGLTNKCKACHKVEKNATGPSFKSIQAAYGDPSVLAQLWADGFKAEDRHIAGNEDNELYKKYNKKAKMMTAQYNRLIKKKVEAGDFTYQALAEEVFSK